MTGTLIPFPPSPTFPVEPEPVHFERADTHARLILSQAQELLLRLVADATHNSTAINGRELATAIRNGFADLASELSGAFGMAADDVPEPV